MKLLLILVVFCGVVSAMDERFMKEKKPLTLGLNLIEKIQPIEVRRNADPDKVWYSLNSQEIRKALFELEVPTDQLQLVYKQKDDRFHIDEPSMLAVLIQAVKDLAKRCPQQETKKKEDADQHIRYDGQSFYPDEPDYEGCETGKRPHMTLTNPVRWYCA